MAKIKTKFFVYKSENRIHTVIGLNNNPSVILLEHLILLCQFFYKWPRPTICHWSRPCLQSRKQTDARTICRNFFTKTNTKVANRGKKTLTLKAPLCTQS